LLRHFQIKIFIQVLSKKKDPDLASVILLFCFYDLKFQILLAVEGYIVVCTGIHEESQEDQIYDLFSEYGLVKSLHANLDRKTGYLKGYALIEYENLVDAQKAINNLNDTNFLGKNIKVGFAFKKPPEMDKKPRK
jgi:RNA-binding protein 8A